VFADSFFDQMAPYGAWVLFFFLFVALTSLATYLPTWQKQSQDWAQQRKEHQQKVEALLTEIRELLRQKP
jgi:large-conductance mechanosensitive channel